MTELAEKRDAKPSRAEVELNVNRDAATTERALLALVACNGNARKAERLLKQDDIEISHNTLYYWKTEKHKDDYDRLRDQALPEIRKRQADAHRALEQRQLKLSKQAAKIISDRLPKMEDKDLINAMGKADIGSGIHSEKAQELDGGDAPRSNKSAAEVLRELAAEGLMLGEKVEEETEGRRVSVERFAALPSESSS